MAALLQMALSNTCYWNILNEAIEGNDMITLFNYFMDQ